MPARSTHMRSLKLLELYEVLEDSAVNVSVDVSTVNLWHDSIKPGCIIAKDVASSQPILERRCSDFKTTVHYRQEFGVGKL